MDRNHHKLFSKGSIAGLTLSNRLVRSATWDPSILIARRMTEEVLGLYRNLALGGIGMIISGGLAVYRDCSPDEHSQKPVHLYGDLRVHDLGRTAEVVHQARSDCKIIAQLEVGYVEAVPSAVPTPLSRAPARVLAIGEIEQIVTSFVDAIADARAFGFDGVQLHAAHGGLLSRFLSPFTNRRQDEFGGTPAKRANIVKEIIVRARKSVGDWPILIKMNCTDYLVGGVDIKNLPALAAAIVQTGVDAIELSGGMWECLFRPENELGFRPVPAPEAHTRIQRPERQSYFMPYAEKLNLPVPVILAGGNRDVEKLEAILDSRKVDFIGLCRPLIREPDLPNRWRTSTAKHLPECISCNSCLYALFVHPGRSEPGVVSCVCKDDKPLYRQAQRWLGTWRDNQG